MKKLFVLMFAFIAMVMFDSCLFIRSYDKPEYVQIDTNETAFVIHLFAEDGEDPKKAQVTLTSEDY